jgi:asparagine synthase (glutamine-hydrolysing)
MQALKSYIAQFKIGIISPSLLMLSREIVKSKKTFLDYPRLLHLTENFLQMRKRSASDLQVAEFGVGRGGSALLLAWLINRYGGKLILFDVFGRIPEPSATDGEEAQIRFKKIKQSENSDYYGNIPNLLDILKQELESVCPLEQIEFVQGKYEDTLPQYPYDLSISFAHIDCDWYESAKAVLGFLSNHIKSDGILQIDDYSYWSGAKTATDEAAWLQNFARKQVSGALIIDRGHPKPQ